MAAKKKTNPLVAVLERIEARFDALDRMEADLRAMRTEVNGLRGDVDGLRGEVRATNARLDTLHEDVAVIAATVTSIKNELPGLRGEAAHDLADHEERLRRLEDAVFKPAAE